MKNVIVIAFFLFTAFQVIGQNITIEGYAYEEGNRGYLNEVYVKIYTQADNKLVAEPVSNMEGYFSAEIPAGAKYILIGKKDLFFEKTVEADASDKADGDKVFVKMELKREPGYLFDITIAPERANEDVVVDGIVGAKIEIYNNTKDEVALAIDSHPSMNFQYTFKKGNWYTTLIRAEGFFTKRLEAHVDIDGCILCFEGIGDLRPAVQDNLTEGNEMGSLLANIEMRKIEMDKTIPLENIYYDYRSASLRDDAVQELEKLINILRDNPQLIVEIGSHTDSRGDAPYNLTLSQQRAQSVVDYLEVTGNIDGFRIRPRGYGESKLVNKCKSGVECTEEQHAKNRRTELKVVGLLGVDPLKDKSLNDIKEEERLQQLLRDIQSSDVIEIPSDGALPDEIKKDLEAQEAEREKKALESDVEAVENTNVVEGEIKDIETKIEEIKEMESVEVIDSKKETLASKIKPKTKTKEKEVDQESRIFPPASDIEHEEGGKIAKVSKELTGYLIQILHSSSEIEPDHKAFGAFKRVFVEPRKSGGFSYLLGVYPTKETAKSSIADNLSKNFPDAFVVQFEKGIRVKQLK